MPSEKVAGVLERLGVDVPAESLSHYGVPGMKWGQRKASDSGSSKSKKAPIGSVERMHQDAKAQGLVFDKKTNSYSPPGQPKASAETMARVRVAALSSAGVMNRTIKDTRNVNSAAGVFNPNTLLNRTNNG